MVYLGTASTDGSAQLRESAQPGPTSRIKSTTVGGDGRFTLAGAAPGEYPLYAFEQLKREPCGDWELEFLEPFESKAMKLSLEEGERKQVDVKPTKLQGDGSPVDLRLAPGRTREANAF